MLIKPIPPETVAKIESVVRTMNRRFTWTCETLSFVVANEDAQRTDRSFEWFDAAPLQAQGFTKVAADEWNACLVIRFVTWLSRTLPDAVIALHDEGRYIPAGHVVLEAGEMRLDPIRLSRRRGALETRDDKGALGLFQMKIAGARVGRFFEPVWTTEYVDRKEIEALGIPKHDLVRMTLEDVADRITFPWDAEPRPREEAKA